MDFVVDMMKGLLLGASVFSVGILMDRFISYNEYKQLIEEEKNRQLYSDGMKAVKINLLVITPISYSIATKTIISYETLSFQLLDCILVIFIHNFGYFLTHKLMHNYQLMYKWHSFHHKFDNILIPSIGNATSKIEFILAYIITSFVAGYAVRPNEITFITSICIISFFNLCIHCEQLKNICWIPGFVTPLEHHQHHNSKTKKYSGSIVKYDWIFE